MQVSLICGGPSPERGISLNSARSLLDHLTSEDTEVVPFYLDQKKRAYRISTAQLYSNTPSDFDFKLSETGKPLSTKAFVRALKETDLVFPTMHGAYGEDGGIQQFLERNNIPFVGSGSEACKSAFDKFAGNEHIQKNGFFALPSVLLKIYAKDHAAIIKKFFADHKIKRAIVKPATGGSSIGVFSVSTEEEALDRAKHLFSKRADTRVVVEQFAEGKEFTVIILQNRFGLPVALPPTEMEMDYSEHQFFDFRKKYLPTHRVTYHSPPRFADAHVEKIQAQAEQLFALFGMHDFARFDGWILPSGDVWFCDFNTISGMEQNSFLFQQGSRIGLTHADVLRYIIQSAARRHNISFPHERAKKDHARKSLAVLFGGGTSERQVSLMSGTNVWLKLRNSNIYEPHPYLLEPDGKTAWKLPYHLTLNHTIEEIIENCRNYPTAKKRFEEYEARARLHLGFSAQKDPREFFEPTSLSLQDLLGTHGFIFNALHGGEGEDGTLQTVFAERGLKSNGPGAAASRLCMDKWQTAEKIRALKIEGVNAVEGAILETNALIGKDAKTLRMQWSTLTKKLRSKSLVVKPRGDGCSTGVARFLSVFDLATYLTLIKEGKAYAPIGTFKNQPGIIEMPSARPPHLLLERFMETDSLRVVGNSLKHKRKSGLVEITIGVLEEKGVMRAMNPSITIAEGEVLSVEEKFQGGTGVNLTPPPASIMSASVVKKVRRRIEVVAKALGISGYSRIDAFANIKTGELRIIEVNTLPGLTPSTVLYHQALAEHPPLYPRELLELFIKNKGY